MPMVLSGYGIPITHLEKETLIAMPGVFEVRRSCRPTRRDRGVFVALSDAVTW